MTKEVTLPGAGTVTFEWRVLDAVRVSNPDGEIRSDCPIGGLPKAGTLFFRVKVTIRNAAQRPVALPKMSLLMANNDATYGVPLETLYLGLTGPDKCVPKTWSTSATQWRLLSETIPARGSIALAGEFQVGPVDRDVQIEVHADPLNVNTPPQVTVLVPAGTLGSYFG